MKTPEPKILYLTLRKNWFDMISSGEKKEEYREIKPYWEKRLSGKSYDVVKFRNGYRSDSPSVAFQLLGVRTGFGRPAWGAPEGKRVFILDLGKKLENKELFSFDACPVSDSEPISEVPQLSFNDPPVQYLAGLDKLKVSLHLCWKDPEFLPMLADFREQLRMSEKEHIPCDSIEFFDGMRFNMRPYGASKYPYVLDSGDITLMFSNHKPGAQFPNCRIEIGSMSCWHPGWLNLYERVIDWLRGQGAVVERQKLSHFDLTVDLLGIRFAETGFADRRRWVARCNEGGDKFKHWIDNYIHLGKGDFMFKAYGKTEELDPSSAKYDFFHDLWRDHTGGDVEHATRLEFQFRRPKIKELGIKSVYDLSQKLNAVWAYCVGGGEEGNGWCRFVDREITSDDRKNKNQQRYAVDELWEIVRNVRFSEGRTFRLVREKTQHLDIERLTKMMAGCGSSLCAAMGLYDDDLEGHINIAKYLLEEQMRNNYLKDRKEYRRKIQTKYNVSEITF